METLTTLQELLTGPITPEEGRTFIRDLVATAPIPIPIQVLDTPGTPEAAIVWGLGTAEATRSEERRLFAASGFRSLASRAWLALFALEMYGLPPREATYATTPGTISNSSGALYGPFAAGALRFVNSTTDKVYVNEEEVTIPIGPSSLTAGMIAIEPGTGSDAQIGEIDRLETPLDGVTVTNAQPALAQDEETKESINDRIDARIGAFGVEGATGFSTGGTASAFESIAKNGVDNGGGVLRADGSRIVVTRTNLVLDELTGELTLYVADDDGPLAGGDLALVEEAVQAYAEWIGRDVTVANTVAVTITVSATLTITDIAATDAQILEQIDLELLEAGRRCPVDGFEPSSGVPLRYVENAVERAGDDDLLTSFTLVDITLTDPTGLTALAEDEVPVFERDSITIVRV